MVMIVVASASLIGSTVGQKGIPVRTSIFFPVVFSMWD